jgi:predicted transcriptional regulator
MMNVDLLKRLGIEHKAIAARLELTQSAISMKANGHRPWKRDEIDALLELCREVDPAITYEQLFGATESAERVAS